MMYVKIILQSLNKDSNKQNLKQFVNSKGALKKFLHMKEK